MLHDREGSASVLGRISSVWNMDVTAMMITTTWSSPRRTVCSSCFCEGPDSSHCARARERSADANGSPDLVEGGGDMPVLDEEKKGDDVADHEQESGYDRFIRVWGNRNVYYWKGNCVCGHC